MIGNQPSGVEESFPGRGKSRCKIQGIFWSERSREDLEILQSPVAYPG